MINDKCGVIIIRRNLFNYCSLGNACFGGGGVGGCELGALFLLIMSLVEKKGMTMTRVELCPCFYSPDESVCSIQGERGPPGPAGPPGIPGLQVRKNTSGPLNI